MIEARKSGAAGALFAICVLVSGLMLATGGVWQGDTALLVVCGVCTAVTLGVFIDYLRTPVHPFYIDEHDRLVLHDGTVLEMQDIWDVSYRRATGRGVQYSWGRVTITCGLGELKYRYIGDCESIAKSLLRRVYAAHGRRTPED